MLAVGPYQPIPQQDFLASKGRNPISLIVLGAFLLLGGFFVLFGTYKALPSSSNILSRSSTISQSFAYISIGIGILSIVALFFRKGLTELLLFAGTQRGCDGSISSERGEAIFQMLDKRKPESIRFNHDKMAKNVDGGTCTAMALQFLATYFAIKKESQGNNDHLFQRLRRIGREFATSSEEMRTRQAAYNTIEVLKSEGDHSKDKVQACVNYHGFRIGWASPQIDTTAIQESSNVISSLPEGAFLFRVIKPAKNEKLEEHGHSVVFIKENGVCLFYDPNYGLKAVSSLNHVTFLMNSCFRMYISFQTIEGRFYRIEPDPNLVA